MFSRTVAALIALAIVAVAAAPASAAKPARYSGKTTAGDPISFNLAGGKLTGLRSATPMSCVPTQGTPRAGTDLFEPAGAFALGRTTTVQSPGPVESAMHYAEVTKFFRVSARRSRHGKVTGTLHQNYSFETIGFSWGEMILLPWVCQGDARFSVAPRKR